jgi:hypothetical protein
MSPSDASPASTDSPRSRFCLPHWGWFLLATVGLVVGFVGLSIWLPWHREQAVVQQLDAWGARVVTETRGPQWLRHLVSEEHIKGTKVFERVIAVELSIGATTDAEIAQLGRLANLEWLNIQDTAVTDLGLVELHSLTNLEDLCLDRTAVTDKGLTHLSSFMKLDSLRLSETAVTDSGLAHLSRLTNLRMLYLDRTSVTNAGLAHLSGMADLVVLGLNGTAVSDSGLAYLRGFTKLIYLDLIDTQVTDEGIEELKIALPECEITRE